MIEAVLSATGGPPELRKLMRTMLIHIFGDDLRVRINANFYRALFSAIEEKKASSPMLSLLLSQIDAYIGGESDGANIVGFVDYVFVERGFKEEVATSSALRDALNDLTKKPSSSFKYAMPDYDSDDEEPDMNQPYGHKKRLRMYGFLLLALAFLAVGAIVPSRRKKENAVNAKPWPLNPNLQLDFTPLWVNHEPDRFMKQAVRSHAERDLDKRWENRDNERFQAYREVHESDEMSFRVDVVSENPELDTKLHNQSIKWANYLRKVIDPVYLWDSSVKLNIVLSEQYSGGTGRAIGQYDLRSKRIWVRYDADEPQLMLDVIAHEIAHRTHLDATSPAVRCRTGFCLDDTRRREYWSATNRQNVYLVLDEAKRVLFLGAKSKTMSPAEARLFMKMHLDTRIKEAYSAASHLEVYSEYLDAYAFTHYNEFWAEASVAYIIGTYSDFPSRDQIRIGDPKLFSLLEEVYSGVPV